jgi:hypothetical protein
MQKRFLVVTKLEDGGVQVHKMKEWLRAHPQSVPSGLDATTSTSHQLRNALRRQGWTVDEDDSEVRLTPPGMLPPDKKSDADDFESEESNTASFGLESHLQDFIAANIETISVEGRRLKLYVDVSGTDGIEYPTSVGRIDILAVDHSQDFFVFELKRARSPDHAIGQLARYMGWVKETIGKDKNVFGVIVAREISEGLRFAAAMVPNVSLFEYEVNFKLNPAHQITRKNR